MYHRVRQLTNGQRVRSAGSEVRLATRRGSASTVRLGTDLRRRVTEVANKRNISESEAIRQLLRDSFTTATPDTSLQEELLRDIRESLEQQSGPTERAIAAEQARFAALSKILERLLVQSTEILMILRVVTFKDRPDDYQLAMTQTQDQLTRTPDRTDLAKVSRVNGSVSP
jgi:hypothetical protein